MSVFKNTAFLVVPCDMPELTPAVLSDLLTTHEPHFRITSYSTELGVQPFPGIYEPSLLEIVRNNLKQGDLSMHGLLDLVPAKKVINWKGCREVFYNVNYRKDLTRHQEPNHTTDYSEKSKPTTPLRSTLS
jgi:molybdopterin-guanine dinucleotide biosynthesis protein A